MDGRKVAWGTIGQSTLTHSGRGRDLLEQRYVLGFELIYGVVYTIDESNGLRYAPGSMEDQLIRLAHDSRQAF